MGLIIIKKIVHIINGLGNGGAESMLYKLLKTIDKDNFEVEVISLTNEDYYKEKIENLGVKVHFCNIKNRNLFTQFLKMIRICKDTDVIQTWMYHSNLIGFILAKFLKKKLIWGLHHSNFDTDKNKKTTLYIVKLSAIISKNVDIIVSCGEKVKQEHVQRGYSQNNHIVILNGFDIKLFKPVQKRVYFENEFGVVDKFIGLHVGRWNPLKDYNNLFQAISILKSKRNDIHFFLAGNGLSEENLELVNLRESLDLNNVISLIGPRSDIPELMASADLFILSSSGEGLPNVLGEAMAGGTCCITTDVGDCKFIVREYGEIVPPQNSARLAEGIEKVLGYSEYEYQMKSHNGRKHIIENFDLEKITESYIALY